MTSTTSETHATSPGRVLLWIGLVISLVIGGMFLAVALTNGGDEQTGGYMVAIPAAFIAGLCAFGLSRGRTAG